jgi:FkbM family methyltransferase
MIVKSTNGVEYECHDWDNSFIAHISTQDPVHNFAVGKERQIIMTLLENRDKRTFVDVGGHLGFWSLYMSKIFKKVLCFEPNPETFSHLKYNTSKNENIKLFNNALGDEDGYVEVLYHIGYETNPEIDYKNQRVNSGMSRVKKSLQGIKSFKLDNLEINDLDFIKLDCEGFELMVLKGSEKTIKNNKPIIVIETNGLEKTIFNVETDEVHNYLISLGYNRIFHCNEDPGVTSNSIYTN